MVSSRRLKVALVGCGDISGRHISAFAKYCETASITACCDTSIERAQRAASDVAKTGALPTITQRYEDVLADPEIDAVDLCLPHHLHAPAAIQAAQAGKHVLCEKPLALNVEECDAMIVAAEQAGVVLCHGEPMRCAGVVMRAAAMIAEGAIGRIMGLQATFAYWQRPELNTGWRGNRHESGGGHLMDGGIHIIDVLRQLGGEIVAVQAMLAHYRPELGADSEDLALLNLRYAEGHCGQLFACHATKSRAASPLVSVFGDAGSLSVEAFGPGNGLVLFKPGEAPQVQEPDHAWVDGYERLIGSFVEAATGAGPLLATPQDGRENVRVVLGAYRSAETGTEITLDTPGRPNQGDLSASDVQE